MEMWVFLAAAGSGYLAKYWQNAQKNKESVSDGQSGKSFTRKNTCRLSSGDKGKWAVCIQPEKLRNGSECSKSKTAEPNSNDQVESYTNPNTISISNGSLETENDCNYQKPNISFISQVVRKEMNHDGGGRTPPITSHNNSLENLGKCKPDVINDSVKLDGGDLFGIESGEKRTHQEIYQENYFWENADMPANNYLGEFVYGGIRQLDNPRTRNDILRFGMETGSLYRRRALRASATKPISSLESCLIAQIAVDNHKFANALSCSFLASPVASERPLVVTDGSRIVSRGGISPLLLPFPSGDWGLPCENINNSKEDESVIGLPCLRKPNTKNSPSLGNVGLMKADSGLFKRREISEFDPSTSSGLESNKHVPLKDTSAGHLLISFGVGIGIMSTIMSSRGELERLSYLLMQTEEFVEDLEEELEMRASLTVKDLTDEARKCLETWQHPLCKEHGQRDASLDGFLKSCEVNDRISLKDPVNKMENMASVEAELEAELEKLELNLHTSKHKRNFSGIIEIDPDCIADVVNGELREDGLMRYAELEGDNSVSTHDEVNAGNFAVSPRDLERRLNEEIIRRLQERIIELEAELEDSQNKLQAIEQGQQQSKELNQNFQSLNSDSEVITRTSSYLENQIELPSEKTNSSKAYSNIPVTQKKIGQLISEELLEGSLGGNRFTDNCYSLSRMVDLNKVDCEDFIIQRIDDEDSKENKNMPLFLSLSGDALSAYNEAYDEFMKMSLEKGTNMFDSVGVEHAKLSKQSISVDKCPCFVEGDLQQKDGKCILPPEPFPLVSTNCWNAGLKSYFSQETSSSTGPQSFTSPKKMDLEYKGIGFKNLDFLDDVVEDTSRSTPCSLKFVDTTNLINSDCDWHTSLAMSVASGPENIMVNMDTLCRTDGSSCSRVSTVEDSQWQMSLVHRTCTRGKEGSSQLLDNLPEVSTSVLDKTRSWGSIEIGGASETDAGKSFSHKVSHCKMSDSLPPLFDNSNPKSDEFDYSEADEQLGKFTNKAHC